MAQGKYGSPSLWFLVQGFNMISNKLQGTRWKVAPLTERSDGAGDSWEEHTPTGVAMMEVAQEGAFFDTSTGNIHDALAAVPGGLTPQAAARVVCLGQEGHAIGQRFAGIQGAYNHEYEVLGNVGRLQRANVGYKATGGLEEGAILHALTTTVTADVTGTEAANSVDNTTQPQPAIAITSSATSDQITCSVPHGLTAGDTILISGHSGSTPNINGIQTVASVQSSTVFTISTDITVGGTGGSFVRAGTSNGGAAYLQWTTLTLAGYSGAAVTVRHSVDNSTFVDLVVMTTATATRGAERKTVAGTVRRYLSRSVDLTGAGGPATFNFMLGFARNP